MKHILLLCFICIVQLGSASDNPTKKFKPFTGIGSAGVYLDQDFLLGKLNEDRNYTMAAGLFINSHWTSNPWMLLPLPLLEIERGALSKPNGLLKRFDYNNSLFIAGYSSFTPEALDSVNPIIDDRPYACLLHFTVERTLTGTFSHKGKRKSIAFSHGFTFGMLGIEFGKWGQVAMHASMLKKDPTARPIPRGWHNQISDDLEPTLRYYAKLQWEWFSAPVSKNSYDYKWFQLNFESETSLGYYTYLAGGASMRLGYFQVPFFNKETPSNVGTKSTGGRKVFEDAQKKFPDKESKEYNEFIDTAVNGDVYNTWKKSFKPEFYLYADVMPHIWIHNSLLHGQFGRTNYRMAYNQTIPVVLVFNAGARLILHPLQFSFMLSGRSPEFVGAKARWHLWGSVSASFSFLDKTGIFNKGQFSPGSK